MISPIDLLLPHGQQRIQHIAAWVSHLPRDIGAHTILLVARKWIRRVGCQDGYGRVGRPESMLEG